jgi:transposase
MPPMPRPLRGDEPPDYGFVPVKTVDQQAALMLVGVRDRLIRQRT